MCKLTPCFIVLLSLVIGRPVIGAEPKLEATFKTGGYPVVVLEFSPDERFLAVRAVENPSLLQTVFGSFSGSCVEENRTPGTFTLWHVETKMPAIDIKTLWKLDHSFSADGKTIAIRELEDVLVWDLSTRTPRKLPSLTTPPGDTDYGHGDIYLSPDGKRLIATGKRWRIWKLAEPEKPVEFAGLSSEFSAATFSPDGNRIAASSIEFTKDFNAISSIALLDGATLKPMRTVVDKYDGFAVAESFSPDGRKLRYNLEANGTSSKTEWHEFDLTTNATQVVERNASDDRQLQIRGDDKGNIKLSQAEVNGPTASFRAHDNQMHRFALTRDGKLLATGADEVKLWRLK